MKIALPITRANQIDDNFGHCEFFNIITVTENGTLINSQSIMPAQIYGSKANIAKEFASQGVAVVLAGGIGDEFTNILTKAGIAVVRGCSGNATELVKQYAVGKLVDRGAS